MWKRHSGASTALKFISREPIIFPSLERPALARDPGAPFDALSH
jgi:hypothetical protein